MAFRLWRRIRLAPRVTLNLSKSAASLSFGPRALVSLGLPDAASDGLTLARRRRKDRPDELLRQVRYERALLYDGQRHQAQARREFERISAGDPEHGDVVERLGL